MPNTERKQPAISRVFSGSKFETLFGFCRALRVGDYIYVSGTAPIKDGKTAGVGDPAVQTRRCFEIIEEALKSFGADRSHVIRTRMFLTRIEDWQQVGAVHAEFFADVRPVATMVEVSKLIDPDWLVEIEAEAFFPDVEPQAYDKRAGDPGAKSTS
jgi:enamine deaminase RidA (YjgF/YER057c/UK114 family)